MLCLEDLCEDSAPLGVEEVSAGLGVEEVEGVVLVVVSVTFPNTPVVEVGLGSPKDAVRVIVEGTATTSTLSLRVESLGVVNVTWVVGTLTATEGPPMDGPELLFFLVMTFL